MLGFRGHFSTKSRRYSTTLGALREARAAHNQHEHQITTGRLPLTDEDQVLVTAHWAYVGQGHTPGEAFLVRRPDRHAAAIVRSRRCRRGVRVSGRDELLTVDEILVELKDVSRRTFYRWREIGTAPAGLRLPNGEIRVWRSEFTAWLDTLREAA